MENAKQLANRLREVLLNGTWIANTNFKDQLSQTSWEKAIHQIGSSNTIAVLTYHINYYLVGLIHVFEGGDLDIRDKYSFDLPEMKSREAWEKLVNDFYENAETFAQHVSLMSDEKLASTFVDEKYGTYERNIEAVIEHSYYHLGQISLIKKLIEAEKE